MMTGAVATLGARSPLLEEGQTGRVDSGNARQRGYPRLRGGDGDEIMYGLAGCCVCSIFLVVICWINFMYAVVPPNHVGISFNTWSKQVDYSQVYQPGRVFSGPFYTYIIFPLNTQNVNLGSQSLRTSDGYPLKLNMDFQYQLMPDKILQLYKHYTVKYEAIFMRNVRTAMMKTMSEYGASDLFKRRSDILDDMRNRADKVLRESFATCWGIQIDDVKQSDRFEQTLLNTQLQIWYANTKRAEQKVSGIKAKTSVLKAEFDKNTSVVNSAAAAKCKFIISAADAESNNYQNEAQANATLITDQAQAAGSTMTREATADAELDYQEAVALGNGNVLRERAEAAVNMKKLVGLRLGYWRDLVGLSADGLVKFQRLLGSYKHLENVKFLFGFENTYATAEASNAGRGGAPAAANFVEMAAVGGAAAATSAATATGHPAPSNALGVPVFAEKAVPEVKATPEL